MSLYQTIFQEKPVIVLEIGAAYTKVGFAAEPCPRKILPTEISAFKDVLDNKNQSALYDETVNFLMKVFFKYTLASPKDRKITIVESVLIPTVIRENIAKVLFMHFEVSSVFFVPSHLVALSTLAIENALVVDLGHKETTVMPVFSGVQVLKAWQAQNLAAEAVHEEIKANLILNGIEENLLSERIIEDIKVRTCFVTNYNRAAAYRKNESFQKCPDVEYPIDGVKVIKIPGLLREIAFEVLFPEDNDRLGLPYIILNAILQCPLDMRKELAENIVLIGGTAMTTGLVSRLKSELLRLMESDLYKEKLFIRTVKFHTAPAKPNFTAWMGGSIYSATDLVHTQSITRENYIKCNKIPDWTNYCDESRTCG